ncbi:MAG: GGDEF domain-containing protein, partial [Miltoncostaeaceae bacterium]
MSTARIGAERVGAGPEHPDPLMSSPLPVAIVAVDLDGVVAEVNPAAAILLGATREALRGTTLARRWPFAEPGRLAREANDAGGAREGLIPAALGGQRTLRYSVAAVPATGTGRQGFMVVALDITADRQREASLDAQRRAALAAALDPDPAAALAAIARESAVLGGAARAGLIRFEGAEAVVVATSAPEGEDPGEDGAGHRRVSLDAAGPVGALERDGGAHGSRDPLAAAGGVAWGARPGERTLALPVRVAGGLWGALWLSLPDSAPDPPEGITAMCDLAGLVAGRTAAGESGARDTLEAAFRGDLDGRRSLGILMDAARRALGALRVTLHIENAGGALDEDLLSVAAEGAPSADAPEVAARLRAELPHWRRLLGRGGSARAEVGDLRSDPRVATGLLATTDARTVLVRPVDPPGQGDRDPFGLLVACWEEAHRLDDRDRLALDSLSALAGVALAGGGLPTGPGAAVATPRDPLTGLLTHRAFQERLAAAAEGAILSGGDLALAFVDIDRFRQVNQSHGHAVGDRVLADVAARLLAEAGPDDVLGRTGGEEFAWLSPRPGVELLNALDRAREAIADGAVGGVEAVTVSAGLCDMGQAGSRDELERFAEGALYWAKQHGRDVALAYTPEVVEVLSADERAEHLGRSQALQSIR